MKNGKQNKLQLGCECSTPINGAGTPSFDDRIKRMIELINYTYKK